jgi:hypothetical protein
MLNVEWRGNGVVLHLTFNILHSAFSVLHRSWIKADVILDKPIYFATIRQEIERLLPNWPAPK